MPVSRQELIEALERTAGGDLAAFKAVYAATSVKLYGIVIRILGRPDLADEVLQEVYVRVWQRAGDFDHREQLAHHLAGDDRAQPGLGRGQARHDAIARGLPGAAAAAERATIRRPTIERSEELRRLYACLDGLEPDKKEIVLLVYYHGMTREEISTRFERPVATVKTWLRRSLAQLKDCLGQ